MGREPVLDFFSLVNLGIVDYDREVRTEGRRVSPIERVEQIQEEPGGFAIPDTGSDGAGGEVQHPWACSSEGISIIVAGGTEAPR